MFAYIIIGIELAILYFIFWVVFIREPKPREIRAELWGRYADSNEDSPANNKPVVPSYLFLDQEKIKSYLPSRIKMRANRIAKIRGRRHKRMAAQSISCSCLCHDENTAINKAGWGEQPANVKCQEQVNRQFAERLLLLLNRALNKLSVKIP